MQGLKILQNELLDSYKELRILLLKNDIKYFAIGGTAIGAFRESGFVPWDDDIDLCITYKDVDKFKKVILDSDIFTFQGPNKRDGQFFPYMKVFDSRKSVLRFKTDQKRKLFIDVMVAYPKINWSKIAWLRVKWDAFIYDVFSLTFKEHKNYENIFIASGYAILKIMFWWKRSKKTFFKSFNWMHNYIVKSIIPMNNNIDKNWYIYHNHKQEESYNIKDIYEVNFVDSKMPVNSSFAKDIKWALGDIMVPPKNPPNNQHAIEIKQIKNN